MSELDTTTPVEQPAAETSGDEQGLTIGTHTGARDIHVEPVVPGEEALGDPGKKALDVMKAAKKEAEAKARAAEQRAAELEAKLNGKDAEFAAAQEAQRIRDEALAAANERILKAEVRAAASKALADPADALRFLNLSDFEVGSDGEVDASQIAAAITDLVKQKPYLAAATEPRFKGSADAGARNEAPGRPAQLTRADLARMTPQQIDEAHSKGQFADLLGQ